jgi:hypothetical protein
LRYAAHATTWTASPFLLGGNDGQSLFSQPQ